MVKYYISGFNSSKLFVKWWVKSLSSKSQPSWELLGAFFCAGISICRLG